MLDIMDKLVLMLLNSCFLFTCFTNKASITHFLIIVILSCFSTCVNETKLKVAIFLIFLGLSGFEPLLFYYLPIMVYDIFTADIRAVIIIAIIPFIVNFNVYNNNRLALFFALLSIGLLAKHKTEKDTRLLREYYQLRDDTKELEIILEKQNQTLLENQDIEITAAMLSERNRISKEIHDNIGHLLSRSLLQIGALLTITKEDITKETLTSLRDSISAGMDSIRSSIHNMHDESIDLYNEVHKLVSEFTFCHISFDYNIKQQPNAKIKTSLINIVKEALNNIMKHSNATNVTVRLLEHPAMYQLIISDNGVLSNTTKWLLTQPKTGDGMGLQSMADRIRSFDGNFNIITEKGFEIFITIPINKENTTEK